MMKGMGAYTWSIIWGGSTGMKMCCQCMGRRRDSALYTQAVNCWNIFVIRIWHLLLFIFNNCESLFSMCWDRHFQFLLFSFDVIDFDKSSINSCLAAFSCKSCFECSLNIMMKNLKVISLLISERKLK